MKHALRICTLLFCCLFVGSHIAAKGKSQKKETRVTIFGDSYSTFEGHLTPSTNAVWYFLPPKNKNDVSRVEETWWWQLTDRMGWTIDRVNSYSGSTICCTGYGGKDFTDRAFITRMSNLGEPDIILICGATNDSWCNAPIGEYKYGDWTKRDLFSFRPAMAKLCWGLRTHYPKAKLLFLLNSELKKEINESVETICAHYDIPMIALENVDKQDGHPSIAGMKAIADQVERWIKKNWK